MKTEGEIITIRGKPYRLLPHDWYIVQALDVAPPTWSFDLVLRLRHAIRESSQHSHGLAVYDFDRPIEFVRAVEGLERAAYNDTLETMK
jgi:hypothetical protein